MIKINIIGGKSNLKQYYFNAQAKWTIFVNGFQFTVNNILDKNQHENNMNFDIV